MHLDPNKTWDLVAARAVSETDPRRRRVVEDRLTGEEVYSTGNAFEGIAARKISLADIEPLRVP